MVYQYFDGKHWSADFNVTENNKVDDFTPVVVGYKAQSLMVVWIESTGVDASELRFRSRTKNEWSAIGTIQSLTAHTSLPTLLVDQGGRIWCFWVGFDGQDDEIYFSVYEANQWQAAQKIYTKDNAVPDILPVARLDKKQRPVVTWRRLDEKTFVYKSVQATLLSVQDARKGAASVAWIKVVSVLPNPFMAVTTPADFVTPKQASNLASVSLYFPSLKGYTIQLDRVK